MNPSPSINGIRISTKTICGLIFSHMFRRSIENYPIYYLTGYLVWQTFTLATSSSVTALADNRSLLLKVRFPLELFLLGKNAAAFVNLGWSFLAYLVMLLVFGIRPGLPMLAAPAIIACLTLFSMGIGCLLAVAYVFFADIKYLYTVLLSLWMYCSAIFYPVEQLPDTIAGMIEANPVYNYIACMRNTMLYAAWPTALQWTRMFVWAAVMYATGSLVFHRCRNRIMQTV